MVELYTTQNAQDSSTKLIFITEAQWSIQKPVKAKEAAKAAKIGDAIQVGDVIFTVTKVSSANTVGDQYLSQEAHGKYLILNVSVKNVGKKAITTDSSFFKLMAGDVEYEAEQFCS